MPDGVVRLHLQAECFRLVPSQFPPATLFDDLLAPQELEAAYALESLTNDRLQDELGNIALVPPEDRVVGPGTTPIMAAFTHIGVSSRFTAGRFGVYYAGLNLETAVAEAAYSRGLFLSATRQHAQRLTMRCYKCRVNAELVDVRANPAVHEPGSWLAGQALARQLRQSGEYGLLYRSVRRQGGECIAVLRPTALEPPAVQTAHFQFVWDGFSVTDILKIERFE